MVGTVEHPDIRYVVYPVHLDGTPTGARPRLRHDPACSHFEWGDGTVLGTPQPATEEQMQTLRACKTCIETRRGPRGDGRYDRKRPQDRRAVSYLQPDDVLDRGL